jgi:hypothetical protein
VCTICPELCAQPDQDDNLPLHYLCQNVNSLKRDLEKIAIMLIRIYPEALNKVNCKMQRPLEVLKKRVEQSNVYEQNLIDVKEALLPKLSGDAYSK